MHSAVIGLGEAGSRYASALAEAGHDVVAFDPREIALPAGVRMADSEREAVEDADFILVLTSAAVARTIAKRCAEYLKPGAIYADMTSATPREMLELSMQVDAHAASFADVAILGPVVVHGEKTPLMISGAGATIITPIFETFGADVELLDGPAGDAMAHKLLRSVFMKGLAALVVETITASELFGDVEWVRKQVANQLSGDGQAVIDRFLTGSRLHAARRAFEMEGAGQMLHDLGAPRDITDATIATLRRLRAESDAEEQTHLNSTRPGVSRTGEAS